MTQKILTASANTGVGVWTAICLWFSMIFGSQSKNYLKKQNKILRIANSSIEEQIKQIGPGFRITDYRLVTTGFLSISITAIATNEDLETTKEQNKICPHCGALNDPDALFCGECGRQLN